MDEYGRHVHPHNHEGYTIARLELHLKNWDHEQEFEAWESHEHFNKVKDIKHYNDRIDVHPWALERLDKAELVFFGIEGCPKADSMLQNILDTGINASVVSVPAIGMWNAPELEIVCRRVLSGKVIVIVPDGDWVDNVHVINQARVFQSRLMEYGLENVYVAAPPAELGEDGKYHVVEVWYEPDQSMEKLKGVDDFLGIGGFNLSDLMVNTCVPRPREEVESWVRDHLPPLPPERKRGYRSDYINRLVDMITALSIIGGDLGDISLTTTMIAKFMHVDQPRISVAIQELKGIGAITVVGEFTTNKSFWGGWEWEGDKPTITLAPELRGKTHVAPLGQVLPQFWGA